MNSDDPKMRRRYAIALAICGAAALWLILGPLRSNVTYFHPVSEAVKLREKGDTTRFRIMGQVVDGSVHRTADGVAFLITDGAATAAIAHHGDPPELFKQGVPVVCEGRWNGQVFDSDRIMIRHGSEYTPPKVTTTSLARATS